MSSNFEQDVLSSHPLLAYVLGAHLHIERWLRELLELTLPTPDAILVRGRFGFADLVSICEALNLFEQDFAIVLRRINTLRNRFAHTRGFEPDENLVNQLLSDLRNMDSPFFASYVNGNDHELALALASVCGHLERLAQEQRSP